MRIPVSGRERTAYIQLRKKGYTMNVIAGAFGRSTSQVHKVLWNAKKLGFSLVTDLRNIPRYVREQHARWSPKTLKRYLEAWEQWICSEDGEPP